MSPNTRLHLQSAGYGVLLTCLNWSYRVEHKQALSHGYYSFDAVNLALLISLGVVFYYGRRCFRDARYRLETGRRVEGGKWIQSWRVMAYALPLLYKRDAVSIWREIDGTMKTASGGYGHTLSVWVFLFAVIGILLFQFHQRLMVGGNVVKSSVGIRQVQQTVAT